MNHADDMQSPIKNIVTRFFHARQIYQYNRSPLRKKEPILVYQMGKVGSSSVRKSINAMNLGYYAYHLHYLGGINNMRNVLLKQHLPLQDHILASIYCRKLIGMAKAGRKKIPVITMVREPISKNLSQFFQNIEVVYPEFHYSEKLKTLAREEMLSELSSFFIKNFIHDDPLVWFDVELKRFTGIDVYETVFPHEKGYRIYENESFKILLVRLENLKSCIKEAMKNFMGIKDFVLSNENVSDEKSYADLYKNLQQGITLPDAYIDKMYSSKLAKHFYTDSERIGFEKKWRRM